MTLDNNKSHDKTIRSKSLHGYRKFVFQDDAKHTRGTMFLSRECTRTLSEPGMAYIHSLSPGLNLLDRLSNSTTVVAPKDK